ncbi:MAG: hypothetical protein KAS30_01245, partial [Candidatus Diapherotrites archaeon]|nr:hypothetical protein [Candidatus Diapherotrites archaeon]
LPSIALLKNACPTTMNCTCCKPVFSTDIQRTNCSPSSKVTVVFKKNHFFFTSFDEDWAIKYHKLDLKNIRVRAQFKKKFFLRTIPTGPFQKNEKAELLLGDAMELVKNNAVDFLNFKKNETTWFCKNKNGVLPTAILNLDNEIHDKEQTNSTTHQIKKNQGIITYLRPQVKNTQINNWLKTQILQNNKLFGKKFSHAITSFFTYFTNELKKECDTHGFTFYHIEDNSIFVDAKSSKILKQFCSKKLNSNTLKKINHWDKILLNGPLDAMAGITKEGAFKFIQKQTHPIHINQKEVIKCFLCADRKKRNEETLNVAKKYITKHITHTNKSSNTINYSKTLGPQLTFFEGFELPVLTAKTTTLNTLNTVKPIKINTATTTNQQI